MKTGLPRKNISFIFDKGIDTKTNEQLTEGYLQLENCNITNIGLKKNQGMEALATAPIVDYANNINVFSSQNELAIIADQVAYEYDPLNGILINRGSSAHLERQKVLDAPNNVTPLFYSEYGNFGALVFTIGASTYLRIQNIELNITINVLLLDPYLTSQVGEPEVVVGLVAIQNLAVVYTKTTAGAGIGRLNERSFPYIYSNPVTQYLNIAASVQAVSATGAADSKYPGFKTIATVYDGSFIWIFYLDSLGNPTAKVRNRYGVTEATITNATLGIVPFPRTVAGDNFAPANLNCFFWGQSPTIVGAVTYSGIVFAQFGNTISIFNQTALTWVSNFALPDLANPYFSQSICSCAMLRNGFFVLKEDLREYDTRNTAVSRVYPYTIQYNLVTSAWVVDDATKIQPKNYENNANEYGQGFVTGALWPTLNNIYFMVYDKPYEIFLNTYSNINVATEPSTRHGNYYIVDISYNLVDYAIHYLGSSLDFPTVGVTHGDSIKSVPLAVINTQINVAPGFNNYSIVLLKNTQVEIEGGKISFDNMVIAYDIFQQQSTKLVSFDRQLTGYYGIDNMHMITQNNVEYAHFLDYPSCVLLFSERVDFIDTFYSYAVTFEYINQNGELFRSAPSVFVSGNFDITMANPVTLGYTFPCPLETKSVITIKIWRTTVNAETYYLLGKYPFVPGSTSSNFVDGDIVTHFPLPDATLIKNEIAYFNGGVLSEIPFDPFNTFVLHNNTFFTVTKDNADIIQYSLPPQISVGMAFTFGFEINVEPRGGDIIELASLDDKLIIFKKEFIYFVTGQPPNALGTNSTLSVPELIVSPVGCSEKLSVVSMPLGIMFKSLKGIYLLDRSLTVQYIGAPVEAFNKLTITSANHSQAENKVRFTTQEGTILVFDYFYNTWATDTGLNLLSSTTYLRQFYGIDTVGTLLQIFDGYYKKSKPYSMTVSTPWVKLAGPQGYQRFYQLMLLGTFVDTHTISLGIMYDYVDVVEHWLYFTKVTSNSYGTNNWGAVVPYGASNPISNQTPILEKSNYEIQFNLPRQKCESARFILSDQFGNIVTDTGNSFTITEILITGGVKSDTVKLPNQRRT